MSGQHFDALEEFGRVAALQRDAEKLEADWQRLTRQVFGTAKGREWLRVAMARYNFMGSVFTAEDGMNPGNASHRDGMRNVLSDVLNSAFTAIPTEEEDDEPTEGNSHVPDPPPVRRRRRGG